MYLVMDDVSRLFGWVLGRFIGKKEPEPEAPEAHVLAERIAKGSEDMAELKARLAALEAATSGRKGAPLAAE
jgi:HAE1 family hydrophobic/amphiphilic exporter-1